MLGKLRGRRPTPAGVIATVALAAALGGVATAAIPDAQGVVTLCVDRNGSVRVIDTATDACRRGDRTVAVNQRGIQGEVGPQGPVGPRGPQGETGPTGPRGPQGETGTIGPRGPQGETGTIGPRGPQGETGPIGPRGPQGETGPAGPPDPAVAAFVDRFGEGGNARTAQFGGRDCVLGEIVLTAASSLPKGFLPAHGQIIPITGNTTLLSAIGFTYGGNGESTFALPDMRPIEPGHMTYGICVSGVFPA